MSKTGVCYINFKNNDNLRNVDYAQTVGVCTNMIEGQVPIKHEVDLKDTVA